MVLPLKMSIKFLEFKKDICRGVLFSVNWKLIVSARKFLSSTSELQSQAERSQGEGGLGHPTKTTQQGPGGQRGLEQFCAVEGKCEDETEW